MRRRRGRHLRAEAELLRELVHEAGSKEVSKLVAEVAMRSNTSKKPAPPKPPARRRPTGQLTEEDIVELRGLVKAVQAENKALGIAPRSVEEILKELGRR